MSYLLDDKKILLKDLLSKNENLKIENENIEIENKAFLCLIEKYEEKKNFLKILEYIHFVCTSLYNYENNLNYNVLYKEFLNRLIEFLDKSILNYKNIFKNILIKEECINSQDQNAWVNNDYKKEFSENNLNYKEIKNGAYDINIEDIITCKKSSENIKLNEISNDIDTCISDVDKMNLEENILEKEIQNKKVNLEYHKNSAIKLNEEKDKKEIKYEIGNKSKIYKNNRYTKKKKKKRIYKNEKLKYFIYKDNNIENSEKKDSNHLIKERNICLYWNKEESKNEFYLIQHFKQYENKNRTCLNLKEKQQLILNEIEKLKNEIKKITLYFENTKILINSVICQSKIFLFELDEEIKSYKIKKETIKNDNFLIKKSNTINDFYNGIINKQKMKIDDAKKTNETLLNLYKKKFSNINYIISINENINNVDFLYLNVLIHNKKLNYDKLMKEHEQNYSYLRKLLNEINNIHKNIKENEKKEKEIISNIEKNKCILNDMDKLIIEITNKIDSTSILSNKINQKENIDILSECSILDCIQLNKDIINVEKKIKSYQRKIDIIKNIKIKK
ncbi:conserved Plasmodium protein, unknown function [Plasmodium relictum]|uniref:Uncharacterized protein n=1 Tax=Plasmodium relictum TaxID=85471 RepID=A0A1J1H1S3_PLARL|nr:conserved Plasmodium protein, unknown function [Plasmodium relictum]CRG98856.1 conserved Plasmodium protein, unknown function [Plasmodium relictum]